MFPKEYGLEYPIVKVPGSPWIVVGAAVFPRHHDFAPGEFHSLDIHLDADDPNHKFEAPEDWPESPASLVEQVNTPFRRSARLARRRATSVPSLKDDLFDRRDRAMAHLMLNKKSAQEPRQNHVVTVGRWTVGCVPAGGHS